MALASHCPFNTNSLSIKHSINEVTQIPVAIETGNHYHTLCYSLLHSITEPR